MENNFFNILFSRKSVRNFTDKEVTKEQLEHIVKAGMTAPSAMNKQPWTFIIIDDRKLLDTLGDRLPHSKMLMQASAAIIVCGDMHKALEDWQQEYWVQDCSAASMNILLATEAMGLGSVWTGLYPAKGRVRTVVELLGLPEHIIPLNAIPIGYPAGIETPKDKFNPSAIHWNGWKK
ncbi:MAG: nitroreductase family protein [Bacteroidota bacterium]|nr:nitroreductase family protein [Bacteroidota bacterium]